MVAGAQHVDLVIRNGTVVDGTGAPRFVGDVAVTEGVIVGVGPGLNVCGKRELDAKGLLVTPGWIDCHTHFDAQVTWDPYLSPSTANGVTTCIFGNCGIGFAPCQPDRREFLAHIIEAVEDLPGPVITQGMVWDWETFEEYLDSVGRRKLACDVAVMVGHAAVRTWVMGKRASAADRPGGALADPVKPHEVEAMASIVQDAVAAGALGFSTSRLLMHRDKSGFLTPGTLASREEVLAIARGVARGGGGMFQWSPDWAAYDDVPYAKLDMQRVREHQEGELRWMTDIAKEHGDKVALTWTLGFGNDPDTAAHLPAMQVRFLEEIKQAGGLAKAQVFVRPQGFLWSFEARLHPFLVSGTFQTLQRQCKKEGWDLLLALSDTAVRARIIGEVEVKSGLPEFQEFFNLIQPWDIVYRWTPHYEPGKADSVRAMAEVEGRTPLEVAYDLLSKESLLWKPFVTWATRDLSVHQKLFEHPQVIPGGDDAGAHHTIFMDATCPSHMLTHWVRDRTRGPRFSLEHAVKKHTSDIAEVFGLHDRGVLLPGKKADINVIDFGKLRMRKPHFVRDLPLGAARWLQEVDGYSLTLVSGRETFRDGKPTGELPGRLVRNPRRDAGAWRGAAAAFAGRPFDEEAFAAAVPDVPAAAAPAAPGTAPAAAEEESRRRALEGAGRAGTSAAARVLREVVEGPGAAPLPAAPPGPARGPAPAKSKL